MQETLSRLDPLIEWSHLPQSADAATATQRMAALAAHLRTRTAPRYPFDVCDRVPAARAVHDRYPQEAEGILAAAVILILPFLLLVIFERILPTFDHLRPNTSDLDLDPDPRLG